MTITDFSAIVTASLTVMGMFGTLITVIYKISNRITSTENKTDMIVNNCEETKIGLKEINNKLEDHQDKLIRIDMKIQHHIDDDK